MQPIDWQPTVSDDRDIPGLNRSPSAVSHGSFHSSGHDHDNFAGRGVGGYGPNGSDHGHGASLQPIPDHDFTAGSVNLAPVGGYADLARGPSPQPMAELNRGPSLTRQYDGYGVPLHHQGAYDYNGNGARY